MALLATQQVAITGLAPTYGAVSASDTVVPDDRTFLHVKNVNASPDTCTVVVPGTAYGQARPDVAVTVPATTGDRMIGPMVYDLADPTTGLITVTHSNTNAQVTCALLRV